MKKLSVPAFPTTIDERKIKRDAIRTSSFALSHSPFATSDITATFCHITSDVIPYEVRVLTEQAKVRVEAKDKII